MIPRFHGLLGEGSSDITIKRSRFLGRAVAVRDEEEAASIIKDEGATRTGASHVAFSYRIVTDGAVMIERYSDAGEPHGTAGPPLLELLRGHDLSCALVLVVRYYGGTNLGMGGLLRAYQEAGRLALEEARSGWRVLCRRLDLKVPYPLWGALLAHLPQRGWLLRKPQFGELVFVPVWAPVGEIDEVVSYLGQLGSGKIGVERKGLAYFAERSDGRLEGANCWIP